MIICVSVSAHFLIHRFLIGQHVVHVEHTRSVIDYNWCSCLGGTAYLKQAACLQHYVYVLQSELIGVHTLDTSSNSEEASNRLEGLSMVESHSVERHLFHCQHLD